MTAGVFLFAMFGFQIMHVYAQVSVPMDVHVRVVHIGIRHSRGSLCYCTDCVRYFIILIGIVSFFVLCSYICDEEEGKKFKCTSLRTTMCQF